MAPLSLLPTEQQEHRNSIYNSNSLTQIDLKTGIIGSFQGFNKGWRSWAERGGNRKEQSPAGCRWRRNGSPLFSSVSWSAPHCKQEMWILAVHLGNHTQPCDLFIVTGEWPLGILGMLPLPPFQLPTPQLGPTVGLFRLCFTEWSAKGLDYGLHFPEIFFFFLVCPKNLCLQHLRPVHVFICLLGIK